MKTIVIEVSPEGEVKIEAVGFKGQACEQATRAMEAALGVAGARRKKPEYYATHITTQRIGQ